jgi:hypothetical protein
MSQCAVDDLMFEKFREIRRDVWFKATGNDKSNQDKLKKDIFELADKANLAHWQAKDPQTRTELWRQVLTKVFYAGFSARTVHQKLPALLRAFGDPEPLRSPEWNVRTQGQKLLETSGRIAREYFASKEGIGHPIKVRKIVTVGRAFAEYFDKNPDATALDIVTRGKKIEDVWQLSANLGAIGLTGQLIQLHLLMDLGFDCIKPDIVISRLVLKLGWLAKFAKDLPAGLTEADLRGKGKYGSRFHYTNTVVIKPIVDLARAFASRMRQEQETLNKDIGWVSSNPMREFDIFMVSYGQRSDPSSGILRQLDGGGFYDSVPRGCGTFNSL